MAGATRSKNNKACVQQARPLSQDGIISDKTPENTTNPSNGDEVAPLGEGILEAVAAISRLEELGLDKLQISIPKCVVLGEQSTGKSSVIEAISGIKTPRSDGTCTRCPLFIKMVPADHSSTKWTARVHLRLVYAYEGKGVLHNSQDFPGWIPKNSPDEHEFGSACNPEELAVLIEHAQVAILNPSADPMAFIPSRFDRQYMSHRETPFSPNCVCIEVMQTGLPPLSFYDLPGIIGQAEDEETQFLVKFVRDLVTKYIKDVESLVIITCSLSNDIHNSTAAGIARELQVTGRCIGVLTKPDCLPRASREEALRAVLDGRRFALGHGYFVVKNPSQDAIDTGVSHQVARRQEKEFFEAEEPWAHSLRDFEDRFGTHNLQTFLSKRLAAQTLRAMPNIHVEINRRLSETQQQLSQIPESPTHDAGSIVSDLLYRFSTDVRMEMEGEYPRRDWRNEWNTLQQSFADELESLKPQLSRSGKLDAGLAKSGRQGATVDESIVIDSDGEDEDQSEKASKKRKLGEQPHEAQTPSNARPSRAQIVFAGAREAKPNTANPLRRLFNLDELASELRHNSKTKLPGQIEPKLENHMILDALKHWEEPMNNFFNGLQMQLQQRIGLLFHDCFGAWQDAKIYSTGWMIVQDVLNSHFQEQRLTMAMECLKDELDGPYIYHRDLLDHQRAIITETYKQARYKARMKAYFAEHESLTGQEIPDKYREAYVAKHPQVQASLRGEPYGLEVGLVAKISAYYAIAWRRFHDSVCMRIESKMFKFLRSNLRSELASRLKIHEANGLEISIQLLAECSGRLEKRKRLLGERDRLVEGQRILGGLEQKFMARG